MLQDLLKVMKISFREQFPLYGIYLPIICTRICSIFFLGLPLPIVAISAGISYDNYVIEETVNIRNANGDITQCMETNVIA